MIVYGSGGDFIQYIFSNIFLSEGGGIQMLDVSVKNTRKCHLT